MKKTKLSILMFFISFMLAIFCQNIIASEISEKKVNINTATEKELCTLKHVGKKIAKKIVEYRESKPFEKIEDIKKVKGIGRKVFEANKDLIIVNNQE